MCYYQYGGDNMARQARVLSETGMYHIMFRGLNKQSIFSEDNDYIKFMDILASVKIDTDLQIYACCLMPNHVHLFVREAQKGDISAVMKRILSHYAGWYNFKYERTGHLFSNRYKSIPIEDDAYFLTLSRYIHQNPVKAQLSKDMQSYKYSSYCDYIGKGNGLTDIDFLLDMLDENRETAIEQFVRFSSSECDSEDFEDSLRMKDIAAKVKIIRVAGGMKPHEIRYLPKDELSELLKKLIEEYNIERKTLERLTGISRSSLYRLQMTHNGDSPQNVSKWENKVI